jgi:RNA polymerase sigma factor (sigma-70 family)
MTDLEFVQRCTSGDRAACNEFVEKYSRLIYKYISCVLKQKNPGLATQDNIKDIFQEVYVLLSKENFGKLKTFKARNGCSLASWLRQVTVNYAIDYLKKHRQIVSLDEENEEGLSLKNILVDNSFSARDTAASGEKLARLRECIEALGIDDKYFIEFHIGQDLSLEEMKGLFKVSRGAIDMRKARIVERLRECFKLKGEFELD